MRVVGRSGVSAWCRRMAGSGGRCWLSRVGEANNTHGNLAIEIGQGSHAAAAGMTPTSASRCCCAGPMRSAIPTTRTTWPSFVEHSVQSGMAIFLEAMKIYTSVTAPLAGLVNRIDVAEGDVVGGGSCLSAPCDGHCWIVPSSKLLSCDAGKAERGPRQSSRAHALPVPGRPVAPPTGLYPPRVRCRGHRGDAPGP